jgi:hypothetical protein
MNPLELRIGERLGSGALGEVWSAEDESGRRFAVKFFNASTPDQTLASVLAHGNALMRVRHPSVVRIHGIYPVSHPENGQQFALVMEHIDGSSLNKRTSPLTVIHAMTAMHQLANGLQAIHDEGLVHGDLHAGNVILTATGARLIDLFYTHTQAGEPVAHHQATVFEDLVGLTGVCKELCKLVLGLDPSEIEAAFDSVRDGGVETAEDVARIFRSLSPEDTVGLVPALTAAASHPRRPLPTAVQDFYLTIFKLDRRGLSHVTRVVAGGRVVAAYPGVLIAASHSLYELRHRARTVELIRETYIDIWREAKGPLPDEAYTTVRIINPALVSVDGASVLPLASRDPPAGSRPDLVELSRIVGVQGLIGPYLFVEQSDWQYAGGAHPDTTSTFSVVNVESGERPRDVYTADELRAVMAREGRVVTEAFRQLRDVDSLFSDAPEVELSSICPFAQLEGDVRMRLHLIFTTFAPFAGSDRRWSSYTVSEEVVAKGLPERLASFAEIPDSIHDALRSGTGTPIGWSLLTRTHPHFKHFERIVSD